MQVIASTGGKGGTGKSTFAVLTALKHSRTKPVVLADCDVECPNDHLILGAKLENPETVYQEFPELDETKCIKCGKCASVCRFNAIFWIKDKHPIFIKDLCSGCGACWITCPVNAIGIEKDEAGRTYESKVNDNLWLVTGMIKPGLAEVDDVVRETRERAERLAKKIGAETLIVDTAPGAHCNVIHALMNADKAYAVTEPTPLGAHDLDLILQLLITLKIPAEVVLNKAGVGDRSLIEEVASKHSVKITKEIPYSKELIKAYSNAELSKVVDLV